MPVNVNNALKVLKMTIQYEIRKNCALFQVFIVGSNVVQFTSCKRANCVDFVSANTDNFITSNMLEPEEVAQ